MKKVLVTDKVHPLLNKGLEQMGMTVVYEPKMPYDQVKKAVGDYNGIILNSKVICDESFLQANKHLEFIGRLGSGLDIVDLQAAKALNIEVIRSPEGNANAVAEHAIGMLLCLTNHIAKATQEVSQLLWNREANRGIELEGRTLGIYGFGYTGSAMAKKLQMWDMNLITYDKYHSNLEQDYPYVKSVSLDQLISNSDILSIHLPLTTETRGIIEGDLLKRCKPGAIIINSSRGPILKTRDLLDHLKTGHIAGACLDVLENEKMDQLSNEQRDVYTELLAMDQVIATPHVAGWTQESLVKIAEQLLTKIRHFYGQ